MFTLDWSQGRPDRKRVESVLGVCNSAIQGFSSSLLYLANGKGAAYYLFGGVESKRRDRSGVNVKAPIRLERDGHIIISVG